MAIPDIDFGGQGGTTANAAPETNPSNTTDTTTNTTLQQEDVDSLSGEDTADVTSRDNTDNGETTTDESNDSPTGELNVGDSIDVEGTVYTVAENGDLVDADGNVFKEAKDVQDWLKSVEVEDENASNDLSLESIQNAIGITITDEDGNNVAFTDDAEGVKAYVDSVISLKSNELQQAAINRLYQDNPLLKQFQDYVQLTGSPRGFGDIPDRSGIVLDKNNEAQLIAVIKMGAQEFGNKSLNDNYIKYLRDGGGLYDEAKQQLAALVEKDTNYRQEIERQAQEQRDNEMRETMEYWSRVNKLIEGRVISGYRIPESFTKEVNGKKIVVTPKDFYEYVSAPIEDEQGRRGTAYQHALNNLSNEEYLNREILDAWLMFTGGTYKDLIDMAVKEEKVRQLRVKAKENRSTKAVKVIKKSAGKSSIDDIIL